VDKIDAEELQSSLEQFSGTTAYYRCFEYYPNLILTDGALYLAQQAACFWLMEIIGSQQTNPKLQRERCQAWTLRVGDKKSALLICADFDQHVLTTQSIEYTDFPLARVTLHVKPMQNLQVILLPSED